MLPDGVDVLCVALALVPGWLYLRLRSRRRPASTATGLGELLEVVAIGLVTTGISCFVWAVVPHRWVPWLLDPHAVALSGTSYLRQDVTTAAITVAAVLLVATLIAVLLDAVQGTRSSSDMYDSESSVWGKALGLRPEGTVPWVGIYLASGQFVEGVLHSLSYGHETRDERDIALARPIRVTEPNQTTPHALEIDRIVVSAAEVKNIVIMHLPERQTDQ